MESVGAYFLEVRRAKGLTLEEVARLTRVPRCHLEALEADAFNRLPAPAFTKGFIRAYCQVLNEPAEPVLARYRELIGEPDSRATPVALLPLPQPRSQGPVLVSLGLLIVLGLSLFILTLNLQDRAAELPLTPASEPRGNAAPVQPVSVPPPEAPPVSEPEPQPRPARLVARTSEPTWIRVQFDDGQVVQELLPAGATREWTTARRFVLTIGNAGGIALELNGQPIPPLGATGEVIQRLVLPPETEAARP